MNFVKMMFCLYDKVAGHYMAPSLYDSQDLAMRDLRYLVKTDDRLRSNAADYELIHVGTFDLVTGTVCPCDHIRVCVLSDLVEV